jgi:hypothetical protein
VKQFAAAGKRHGALAGVDALAARLRAQASEERVRAALPAS